MSNDPSNFSDLRTGRQVSSIILDWLEAVRQLECAYQLLEREIENRSDSYWLETWRGTEAERAVDTLVRLRSEITNGLIRLEKEIAPPSEPGDSLVEMLTLIEHTKEVCRWCSDITYRLGKY